MIKILKRGTSKEVTCESCGSVLSYEEEDIIKEETKDVKLYEEFFSKRKESHIVCPVCNKKIILEATR